MSDWVLKYIETLEIQNRGSKQIQTTIKFYLDVRLSPVIYRDAQNWKHKLAANANHKNF